jgi:Family of unknown function (DUF6279)
MKMPVAVRWKGWIILVALPLLASCSAIRLSYDQGPMLAYWWLDNYADFNAEQAPRVKAALADWFAWHRATQLADYAQALAAMQALAVNPITPAQACNVATGWQRRAERAFDRAVPALADLARTLSPEQLNHIERRQRSQQEELTTEYLQADPAARQKASLERTVDRAESLYGPLDDAQRGLLASGLAASPFNPALWLAERRQRQADLMRSLRRFQAERADADTVQAGLRRLAAETAVSPRVDYASYAARLTLANCALASQLHNSTSAAQRQRAIDKLKGWEGDLRSLARP